MEPLKVAIFEPYVWERAYGNLRYINYIFRYLDRTRFLPVLIVQRRTAYTDTVERSGVEVITMPAPRSLAAYNRELLHKGPLAKGWALGAILAFNLRIARTLRHHRITVLQCHNVRSVLMAGVGARLVGCPVILYVKTTLISPTLDRLAFHLARLVLFQNRLNLEACQPSLQRYRNKFEVLVNGVDLEEIDRAAQSGQSAGPQLRKSIGLLSDRLNLACLATLSPAKGIDYLLQAMKIVQQYERVALYILGTDEQFPSYRSELETFARQYLTDVHFLGWREEPLCILSLMDALVLPSLHEDAPRSVMEAMALGKPVIATRVGGLPSMLEEGGNGFLVPARDAAALADSIIELARNPERRERMGKAAFAVARQRYSLATNVQSLQRLYSRLTGAPSLN